jgi:hypothetical protein
MDLGISQHAWTQQQFAVDKLDCSDRSWMRVVDMPIFSTEHFRLCMESKSKGYKVRPVPPNFPGANQ